MRCLGYGEFTFVILGTTFQTWEIQEIRHLQGFHYGESAFYCFFNVPLSGFSAGIDWGGSPIPSDWTYFETPEPVDVKSFSGPGKIITPAAFAVIGGYQFKKGELHFYSPYHVKVGIPEGVIFGVSITAYSWYAGFWQRREYSLVSLPEPTLGWYP
jgi:hypothetical protein